jgi:tetratricopeptide (TPR) repeat protein
MGRLPRWFVLIVLLHLAGCATVRTGGPATRDTWYLVATDHFVVYSDLDEATATRAAYELETTRDALIAAIWPGATFPELARVRAFVLGNPDEFQRSFGPYARARYAAEPFPAFFLHAPIAEWGAAAPGEAWSAAAELRHEMAHQLVAAAMKGAPLWLHEGLASVLETTHVTGSGSSVSVRAFRTGDGSPVATLAPIARLLDWTEPSEAPDLEAFALRATSHIFVSWLLEHRAESLTRYTKALAAGVEPKTAFDDTFADQVATLDERLAAYAKTRASRGERPIAALTRALTVARFDVDIQVMSPADVNVAQARVLMAAARFAKNKARFDDAARGEVERALLLAPNHVEALALAAGMPDEERHRRAEIAVAQRPEDARAYALLAQVTRDPNERERNYHRSLERSAEPRIARELAAFLITAGRAEDAMPFIERAVRQAPRDLDIQGTYAAALVRLNRCSEALDVARRALFHARETDFTSLIRARKAWNEHARTCRSVEPRETTAKNDEEKDAPHPASTPAIDAKGSDAKGNDAGTDEDPTWDPGRAPGTNFRALHSGLYVGVGVGGGYSMGRYEAMRGFRGDLDGPIFDAQLALGAWIVPALAIGAQAGVVRQTMNRPFDSLEFGTTYGLSLGYVGLLADVYPLPAFPLHFQAGGAFLGGAWDTEMGTEGSVLPPGDALTGFLVHGSLGYAWHALGVDLGPSLRVLYGRLRSDSTSADFGALSLLGNIYF